MRLIQRLAGTGNKGLATYRDNYDQHSSPRVNGIMEGWEFTSGMNGTSTTGDRHEGEIPDHVESTSGHEPR